MKHHTIRNSGFIAGLIISSLCGLHAPNAEAALYSFTTNSGGSDFGYTNGTSGGTITGVFDFTLATSTGTSDTSSGSSYVNVTSSIGPAADGSGNNKWDASGSRTYDKWVYDYNSSSGNRYIWFYSSTADDSLRLKLTTTSGLNGTTNILTFSEATFSSCDTPTTGSSSSTYLCGGGKTSGTTNLLGGFAVVYVPSPAIGAGLLPLGILLARRKSRQPKMNKVTG